jgi:iron complex transport system substrate-binding protein
MISNFPQRIVCLSDETTETLYLLGEEHRIVGISAWTVRPPRAGVEKPRISSFTTARSDDIVALEPDLVLAYSDLQAEMAADLARRGLDVHLFNQRSVAGILQMVRVLGGMIGCNGKAEQLVDCLESKLCEVQKRADGLSERPRVYFEEWDDPLISGIRWVSELIAIAGGEDCFAELGEKPLAKDRIIADPAEVVRRQPDIIIGAWCGKRFRPQRVAAREGWHDVPAIRGRELHELNSSIILQPGPAALTDGVAALHAIFAAWNDYRGSR